MRISDAPFLYFLAALPLLASSVIAQERPIDFVDPRIGASGDESNCAIGPQLPFVSINPRPQTPNSNQNGYNPNHPIRRFGQLHVSGIGWGKYGQIFVSPQAGLAVGESEHASPKSDELVRPNVPAFLAVESFQYAGRPDLASFWVKKLARNGFSLIGVSGNNDSGAMSSWYVFTAMGFFPNSDQPIYYLTGPLWKNVSVALENSKNTPDRSTSSFRKEYLCAIVRGQREELKSLVD